jgi:DNA-binding transcriptional regulator YdaS (Cro superfamily)
MRMRSTPSATAVAAWAAIKASRRVNLAWLADRLGLRRQAVQQWRAVPAERVVEISRWTGIPREELRPDLYEPLTAPWQNLKG